MLPAQHTQSRALQTRNAAQLQQGASHVDAKQVERNHFYCLQFAARFSLSFDISTFSILNPVAGDPSTTAHSYGILIPVVAELGPFDPPEPLFTSDTLYRCRYIAVAQVWTCGEKKLLLATCGACKHGAMR